MEESLYPGFGKQDEFCIGICPFNRTQGRQDDDKVTQRLGMENRDFAG